MTHFWMTIGGGYEDGMIIRYYVDGEDEASIEYTPSMACGVGYYDTVCNVVLVSLSLC